MRTGRSLLWWTLFQACKTWWVSMLPGIDFRAHNLQSWAWGNASCGCETMGVPLVQTWTGDAIRTIRQGAYLSRLTSLSLEPDELAFWDDSPFIDIAALKVRNNSLLAAQSQFHFPHKL